MCLPEKKNQDTNQNPMSLKHDGCYYCFSLFFLKKRLSLNQWNKAISVCMFCNQDYRAQFLFSWKWNNGLFFPLAFPIRKKQYLEEISSKLSTGVITSQKFPIILYNILILITATYIICLLSAIVIYIHTYIHTYVHTHMLRNSTEAVLNSLQSYLEIIQTVKHNLL